MKNILLLDFNNLLYRSFYALKDIRNSKEIHTGAIFGFCKTLNLLIEKFDPFLIYAFDDCKSEYRKLILNEYKANRDKTPEELIKQKEYIEKYLNKIEIPLIKLEKTEADDLIVYFSKYFSEKKENNVIIISSDKDLHFLILESENIKIYDPLKKIFFNKEELEKKYFTDLTKEKIWLYYSILGDSSDNIPGIKGIGEKGAKEISKKYSSFKDLYENINNDFELKPKLKKLILENKDSAEKSNLLIKPEEINSSRLDLTNFEIKEFNKKNLQNGFSILYDLEIKSLLPSSYIDYKIKKEEISSLPWAYEKFKTIILDENNLKELKKEIENSNFIALDTETDGGDPQKNLLMGFSICTNENSSWYIPLSFNGIKVEDFNKKIEIIKEIFLTEKTVIMHNANFDLHVIYRYINIYPKKVFDTIVAAHIFYGNNRKLGLKDLSRTIFKENMNSFSDIVENGKYKFIDEAPIENVSVYGATDARQTFLLYKFFEKLINEKNIKDLFEKVEMPLISVLCDVENTGIYCDKKILEKKEILIENELKEIKKRILSYAETDSFNPLSNKQVGNFIFNILNLKEQTKTKIKKTFSTKISDLDFLRNEHPIINEIINFRIYSTLLSKYIKGLSSYIKSDGRIHTHFQQINVSTGRISTVNPNLQNIPRNSEKKDLSIRSAFIAPINKNLISLDYSHIELRVLAHFSKDKNLCDSFLNEIDVHKKVASEIFKVSINDVTEDQRYLAKRINFGIIYGLSPYGLSKELKISTTDAKNYLDIYKENYSGVFNWIDSIKNIAEKDGFVKTLFGRERFIPELMDKNKNIKLHGLRMAVNTIIQGTAAEIMKLGMIAVNNYLSQKNILKGKIVLQIHDEILVECNENESLIIENDCKKLMEEAIFLEIPIIVKSKISNSW